MFWLMKLQAFSVPYSNNNNKLVECHWKFGLKTGRQEWVGKSIEDEKKGTKLMTNLCLCPGKLGVWEGFDSA